MGLFGKKHRFKSSPLSLSVPLDGCDSVLGLQELQRRKDSDVLAKALNIGPYGSAGKPAQRHYKGPSLWNLTWTDVKEEPKPWLDFIWGSDWTSYSLCEGLTHLGERVEENICHYLPNYLRLFLVFIVFFMLRRPWSVFGLAVAALVALWSPVLEILTRDRALPSKQQRRLTARQLFWEALDLRIGQAQAAMHRLQVQQEAAMQHKQNAQPQQVQQQSSSGSGGEEVAQSWGYMVCTFAVCFTGIPIVLIRASLYTSFLVLAHSSLRQSPTEHAVAVRSIGQGRGIASPGVPFLEGGKHLLCSSAFSLCFLHCPGCKPCLWVYYMSEVLGLQKSRRPDPRRLLKESWWTLSGIASAAGIYVWHAAQSKCLNSLRYFWS